MPNLQYVGHFVAWTTKVFKARARSTTWCAAFYVAICGCISLDVPRKWRGLGDTKEIPKVVQEELNRMESELKEQIRELQEAGSAGVKRSGHRETVFSTAKYQHRHLILQVDAMLNEDLKFTLGILNGTFFPHKFRVDTQILSATNSLLSLDVRCTQGHAMSCLSRPCVLRHLPRKAWRLGRSRPRRPIRLRNAATQKGFLVIKRGWLENPSMKQR